jgi:filamentous hemagglutinin family protein
MGLSTRLFSRRYYKWSIVCFLMYLLFLNALVSVVAAGPEGAQVVNGQVSIQQSGSNTAITASDKAIINYSSFDIAQPETVRFIQPGSNASVLNRILSASPTNIDGTLLANGRVFFVNPAGVYIGNGATINVNQLVASGLNISNADFINGRYNFTGGNGAVINNGDISAQQVYLIGKQVTNSGNINCPAGYVVMAAGDRVFLGEPGSDIVLDVEGTPLADSADAAAPEVGVLNEGTVEAAGGIIALAAAGDIYSQAISNVGALSTSVDAGDAGQVKLASAGGEIVNAGTIEASGSKGGQVSMEGARVGQFGTIHADGTAGDGGDVDLTATDVAALSSDSITTANAGTNGNGGEIIVYSPDTALFRTEAEIEAKGGTESGDGGFVEISGKKLVEVYGSVDASAANGTSGTFYIDPTDVTLSNVTANMDNSPNWNPATPDQDTGTIDVATIVGSLQNGTDVSVDTSDDNGGAGTGRIIVDSSINVDLSTVGGGSVEAPTLTLNAQDDIDINAQIGVSATDAAGDLLNLDLNATNGVDIGADITDLSGGALTSDGTTFNNTGTITTNGGNITLTHTDAVAIGGALSSGSGAVDIDAGGTLALNAGISTSTGDVTLDSTGVTTIAADGDITAGGAVTFGADKAGTLTTSGDIHTTDDNVTFTRAVTLGGNVDIDTTGTAAGNILFSSTIDTAGNSLALDAGPAGNVTLSDALTGGGDVTVRDGAVQSYQAMTLNSLDIQDATTSVTFNGDVAATTNIGIVSGGTVEVVAGSRLIAGGDGTALTVDGAGITLNAGGAGNETLTNTGTGTISITDSGTTSLANNSISLGSGALTIDSANIAAPGNSTEIFTNGDVSLTGAQIGGTTGNDALDIDFAGTPSGNNTLTVNSDGDGDVGLDINNDLFDAVNITLANVTTDTINIDWAGDNIDMETDITALTINSIDTSAFDTDVSITQSAGNVTVTSVNTDEGNFSLTASSGSIAVDTISTADVADVTLSSSAGITSADTDDDVADITTGDLIIAAATNVGASGSALDVDATTSNITASGDVFFDVVGADGHATTIDLSSGDIEIDGRNTSADGGYEAITLANVDTDNGAVTVYNYDNALTATNVAAGGGNNIQLTTTSSGDVLLGVVDATGSGNVTIQATAGSINETGAGDPGVDIIGNVLTLTARDEIGGTGELDIETTAASLDASSTTAGDIVVTETDGITLTDVDTADGAITINSGGATVVTDVAASGSGNEDDVTIIASAGDVTLGAVSAAGAGDVTIQATAGSINETGAGDSAVDITGDLLTLTARDEIGGPGELDIETTAASLDASSTTAGDIVLTETDAITLTDVDTADGAITINTGGATVVADVAASGSGNEDDVTIIASAGDVTLGAVSAAGAGDVTIQAAAGSINETGAGDSGVDISGDLLTLTARDEIGGPGELDIETTSASIEALSVITGDIVLTESDNVILGNIQATGGNIILQSTGGAMSQQAGKVITAGGGSLAMRQRDSLDTEDFTFGNQAGTDLTLQSTNGSVSSMTADDWRSITAAAEDNVELRGTGDIKIGGDLTSDTGGVSIVSDDGSVITAGDTILDNITITGNPAGGGGVDLDPDKPSGGKAAIVIRAKEDLTLGSNAELIANGTYEPQQYDDRSTVGFDDSISGGGDPIDIAIYLRSYRVVSGDPGGHVAVGSKVTIAENGTMIADAGENVTFGGKLNESVFDQTNRLEVVSRRSQNLDEVIRYNRLPFADNPEAIRNWFNETSTGYFTGAYVLRGVKTLLAEVLALSNPVPLVPPRTLEPEIRGEVKGPDTEALAKLLKDLGIGVQPYVTEAYAESLSTDLRLYKAAEKLQELMPVIEDANGRRIAGLRKAVAQFFPTFDMLTDEQMNSFDTVLKSHKGDGTDFDLAEQCISALMDYVNILSTEIGWPPEKSIEFVMGRYAPRITENDEIRIAVIQMHLQK